MKIRQRAEMKNVTASTYRTFCDPISAMPTPLINGPMSRPVLVVVCKRAFAAVN